MKITKYVLVIALLSFFSVECTFGQKERRFKGRIAWSADGNFNDEDDWAASPIALAIFAEWGVKDKLVHFDYNCIVPMTNEEWEELNEASVLGAAQRYGYSPTIFHDVQKDLDAAVNSIANAINASSKDNPLYFVLAGPMEVPMLGIQKAQAEKRKFVYCISHSPWNDGYLSGDLVAYNKHDVIPLGVNWIQITSQGLLATSPYGRVANENEWAPWYWMRDSKDPNLQFLWQRMLVTTRADCSDAGMAYFLVTGDERPDPHKLKTLLADKVIPVPLRSRKVRMEAENFSYAQNFRFETNQEASQRMNMTFSGDSDGEIRTKFIQMHVPRSSYYDIDVRIMYGPDRHGEYTLFINGKKVSTEWGITNLRRWQTKTFKKIKVNTGDEIALKVKSKMPGGIKLDYVELIPSVQGE